VRSIPLSCPERISRSQPQSPPLPAPLPWNHPKKRCRG